MQRRGTVKKTKQLKSINDEMINVNAKRMELSSHDALMSNFDKPLPTRTLPPKREKVPETPSVEEVPKDENPFKVDTPSASTPPFKGKTQPEEDWGDEDDILDEDIIESCKEPTPVIEKQIEEKKEEDMPEKKEERQKFVLEYTPKELKRYLKISPLCIAEIYTLIEEWTEIIQDDEINSEKAKNLLKEYDEELVKFKEGVSKYNTVEDINEAFAEKDFKPVELTQEEVDTRSNVINHGLQLAEEGIVTKGVNTYPVMKSVTVDKSMADKNPVAFLDSTLGVGVPIKVKLLNSGFRIALKYPTKLARRRFLGQVKQVESTVGSTLTNVNSYSFEYHRLNVLTFELMQELLTSSTLNVDNPLDYIVDGDLPLIQMAILKTIYNNGIPFSMPCLGGATIKDGKPACTRSIKGTIDPALLIYVDQDNIPDSIIGCLAKTRNKSLELSDLLEARSLNDKKHIASFETDNGINIEIVFNELLYKDVQAIGDAVIEYSIKHVDEVFEKGMTLEESQKDFLGKSIIRLASSVQEIIIDGKAFSGFKLIPMLNSLMNSDDALDAFFDGINVFKNTNAYQIGIPTYTCGCGEVNGEDEKLRPLNPIHFFTMAITMKN